MALVAWATKNGQLLLTDTEIKQQIKAALGCHRLGETAPQTKAADCQLLVANGLAPFLNLKETDASTTTASKIVVDDVNLLLYAAGCTEAFCFVRSIYLPLWGELPWTGFAGVLPLAGPQPLWLTGFGHPYPVEPGTPLRIASRRAST